MSELTADQIRAKISTLESSIEYCEEELADAQRYGDRERAEGLHDEMESKSYRIECLKSSLKRVESK